MVHVLVVDDEGAIRETIRAALEDAGYRVLEARNGSEALATLRDSQESLVVLVDLLMPIVNGFELLQTVAEDWDLAQRHAYVVISANREALPVVQALRSATVVESIAKPFELDTLLDTVERAAIVLMPPHDAPSNQMDER
jgi:chemotaxis family two-component system sensor histidine kinase/response regulator PixL